MITFFLVSGKSPYDALGGGYSSYAQTLSGILKKIGGNVIIIAVGETDKNYRTQGVEVCLIKNLLPNSNTTALPLLPVYSYFFAKKIASLISIRNYKQVIVWGMGPWGFTGVLVRSLFKKKVLLLNNYFTTLKHEWKEALRAVRIEDYGIIIWLKYLAIYCTIVQLLSSLEQLTLEASDLILTNYTSTENIIKTEFKIPKAKFYRLPFTVSPRTRGRNINHNKLKLPDEFILTVCRQDPRKGINFLLHAMVILRNRGYKLPLLIAGAGEMLEANKKLAKRLKLGKAVKFLGFVGDLNPIFKKADVFCLPSLEEGAGSIAVNEATMAGVPIVTTAVDGIIEDIIHNKTGILVPPADPEVLADAIEKLILNPKLAKKLGQEAKKTYPAKHNPVLVKKSIAKLLSGL